MSIIQNLLSLVRKPVNREFLRNTSRLSVVRVAGLACTFVLQVLLARLISSSTAYGEFAWGQSLLFLVGGIIAMGVPTTTSRLVVALSAQGRERAAARVIRRALLLLLLSATFSILLAAGLTLFADDLPAGNFSTELAVLAIFLAPVLPLSMLYQKLFLARRWLVLAFLPMQVLRPLLTAGIALSVWWASGRTLSAYAAVGIVGLSILLVTLPQVVLHAMRQHRRRRTEPDDESQDTNPRDSVWRASLPVLATRLASLTIEYSNVLLLGLLSGPAAAGAYFAADRLAQLAAISGPVADAANQSRIAAAHATGNREELQLLCRQTAHGSFWPTLGIAVPLAIFAAPLLAVFNHEFASASAVLLILILGTVIKVGAGPNQMLLFMTGLAGWVPPVMIGSALVHLTLLFVLLPGLGALGAAITAALSSAISSIALLLISRRKLGINPTIVPGFGPTG